MSQERHIIHSAQPQGIGSLLDTSFRYYRDSFRYWFLAAACILLPWLILDAIFEPHLFQNVNQFITAHTTSTGAFKAGSSVTVGSILGIFPAVEWLLILLHTFVAAPLLYGILLHRVAEANLYGAETTVDKSFSRTLRRLLPYAGTMILWGIIVAVVSFLLFMGAMFLIAWIWSGGSHNTVMLSILILIVTVILAVLSIWLGTRFSMIGTVTLEEGKSAFRSIGRSWVLTRRNFWRTFGFLLLMYLIVGILEGGISAVVVLVFRQTVAAALVESLIAMFATPLLMLARANLYTDLRIRTDSPDLKRWLHS